MNKVFAGLRLQVEEPYERKITRAMFHFPWFFKDTPKSEEELLVTWYKKNIAEYGWSNI